MIFFHKVYVAAIAIWNMLRYLSKASDKIAAIRIEVVTHKEIEELERVMAERVRDLQVKKVGHEEEEDEDELSHDGFIH